MTQRMVILADVHLGTAATQFPGQDYTYTPGLLKRAVERVQALDVDRVVLLGDVVNMGVGEEYDLVRELLGRVWDRVEPAVGNHELVKGTVGDFERFWGVRAWRRWEIGGMPALVLNSGIEKLPMTQWRGVISGEQMAFLDEQLAAAGGPVMLFCHHPLAGTVRRSGEPMMGLDNTDVVRQRLERHGHGVLLFTGHTHYQDIERYGRLTCVGCPPICFWPHALLLVEVAGRRVTIGTERLVADPRQSPDAGARDPAYRARGEGTADDQALGMELA